MGVWVCWYVKILLVVKEQTMKMNEGIFFFCFFFYFNFFGIFFFFFRNPRKNLLICCLKNLKHQHKIWRTLHRVGKKKKITFVFLSLSPPRPPRVEVARNSCKHENKTHTHKHSHILLTIKFSHCNGLLKKKSDPNWKQILNLSPPASFI